MRIKSIQQFDDTLRNECVSSTDLVSNWHIDGIALVIVVVDQRHGADLSELEDDLPWA